MLVFRLLLVAVVILCLNSVVDAVCTKKQNQTVDANVAKLIIIGNKKSRFPETEQDMPQFCKSTKSYIKSVEDYNRKCLDRFSKQIASVLVFATQSLARQFCNKGSKRRAELMDASKCGNNGKEELQKCNLEMIDSVLGIKNVADHKKKLPMICCAYFKIRECINSRLIPVSNCTEHRIEVVGRMIDTVAGNAIDLMCGDFADESDKCKQMPAPKKLPGQRRTKSFFMPLIEVLSSFPEVEE